MAIIKESFISRPTILFNKEHTSVGVVVSDADYVMVSNRKIVKAGTPLAGDLENRTADFTVTTGSTAKGVLLHDVDVTHPDMRNGTLVIDGKINLDKLDPDVLAMITQDVRAALPMVKFLR